MNKILLILILPSLFYWEFEMFNQIELNIKKQDSLTNLKEILLEETKLGNTNLNDLNGYNIKKNLKIGFPKLKITKEIGKQDGPNFILYQAKYLNNKIFHISMDSYDSLLTQCFWTKHHKIKDIYGGRINLPIDSILVRRPSLKFYADAHYNVYAYVQNSKIEYRLKGNLKMLNDSIIVDPSYNLKKWQIKGMKIEYIVWRK